MSVPTWHGSRRTLRLADSWLSRPGTNSNHAGGVKAYILFCTYFNLSDFPVMADTLCWFMEFLLRSVKSPSTVANYLSAIKLYQARLSQPTDVFDSLSVRLMRRALATTVRHVPVCRKCPSLLISFNHCVR